tara:strand:+ start:1037 stop:1786 length:750 start_codon:yes stop_codon:yes gene_type:complete
MSITSYPNVMTFSGGVGSFPYFLQVSRGLIAGHKRVFKFGYNGDIDDSEETIWDVGGLYAYPASAVTMTTTSSSGATDENVEVTIQGVDASYNELSETVTLNSSGTATTTGSFLRVYRAFVSSGTASAGSITIANGGTTYAYISAADQQTLMALWTVPAGYTAYLFQVDTTAFTVQNNKVATIRMLTRELNGVFRTQNKFDLFEGSYHLDITCPQPIPEKTDIEFRAIADSSNADLRVAASFDIIYIEN